MLDPLNRMLPRTFNDNINNKSKNKYVSKIMITMLQIYEHISLLFAQSYKMSLDGG